MKRGEFHTQTRSGLVLFCCVCFYLFLLFLGLLRWESKVSSFSFVLCSFFIRVLLEFGRWIRGSNVVVFSLL